MKFNIHATVNYPETEVDTPDFTNLTLEQVAEWVKKLINTEPDMTSCVIVLNKQLEKAQ